VVAVCRAGAWQVKVITEPSALSAEAESPNSSLLQAVKAVAMAARAKAAEIWMKGFIDILLFNKTLCNVIFVSTMD
jgi:hypothetical protein